MSIPVFWLEPADLVQVRLRRWRSSVDGDVTCLARARACCDASVIIHAAAPRMEWLQDLRDGCHQVLEENVAPDDPRWPQHCASCGIPFSAEDRRQVWAETLHTGAPDGNLYTTRDAPVGAMWHADWLENNPAYTGPDGLALVVRTPGGEWMVDSQASNCTRDQWIPSPTADHPTAKRFVRTHYCWVRRGDPRDPQGLRTGQPLHVDKVGETCAAGAGSIICGSYHGFLHLGHLTSC